MPLYEFLIDKAELFENNEFETVKLKSDKMDMAPPIKALLLKKYEELTKIVILIRSELLR